MPNKRFTNHLFLFPSDALPKGPHILGLASRPAQPSIRLLPRHLHLYPLPLSFFFPPSQFCLLSRLPSVFGFFIFPHPYSSLHPHSFLFPSVSFPTFFLRSVLCSLFSFPLHLLMFVNPFSNNLSVPLHPPFVSFSHHLQLCCLPFCIHPPLPNPALLPPSFLPFPFVFAPFLLRLHPCVHPPCFHLTSLFIAPTSLSSPPTNFRLSSSSSFHFYYSFYPPTVSPTFPSLFRLSPRLFFLFPSYLHLPFLLFILSPFSQKSQFSVAFSFSPSSFSHLGSPDILLLILHPSFLPFPLPPAPPLSHLLPHPFKPLVRDAYS